MTKNSSDFNDSVASSSTVHSPKKHKALIFSLQGWRRRLLFVLSFEIMAISCSSFGLSLMSGQTVSHASVMGVSCSAIAVTWNWLFNTFFEKWESQQISQHRTIYRRVAHALFFEIPLLISFVLLFSWWFSIGYIEAFWMDLALFGFFLIFTFLYTWGFDFLFDQPYSNESKSE